MKVLLISVDANTKILLEQTGIVCETAIVDDIDDIIEYLETQFYNGCVINLDHKGWGAYICRSIRNRKIATPIVGIAIDNQNDFSNRRALFLENGGDDLLSSPANPRELTATLRAIERRMVGTFSDIIIINYNGAILKINIPNFVVSVNGISIDLTVQEIKLLAALARSKKPLSKEKLLDQMYDIDEAPNSNVLDVFIHRIRKKFEEHSVGLGEVIEIIRGVGLRLKYAEAPIN